MFGSEATLVFCILKNSFSILKNSFSSSLSITLEIRDSSANGRKLLESSTGLPDFCSGIILATFHTFGKAAVCVEILMTSVRFCMAIGLRWCKRIGAVWSGPSPLLFFESFVAMATVRLLNSYIHFLNSSKFLACGDALQ